MMLYRVEYECGGCIRYVEAAGMGDAIEILCAWYLAEYEPEPGDELTAAEITSCTLVDDSPVLRRVAS